MKRLLLLLLLAMIPLAAAYTDTLDADFMLGNTSQVNVTNNTVILPLVDATTYIVAGTFTSQVFDLGSNPVNVTINWNFTTPTSTSILVATRSGPTPIPDASWSSWSSYYAISSGSAVTSPMNRGYQYEVLLATTNNTTTPVLYDVTLNYNQNGTNISSALQYNNNLTSSSVGANNFNVNVSDTYTILNVTARYRYDTNTTNGTFTNSTAMTFAMPTIYNLTITAPTGGWYAYRRGALTIEVTTITSNGTNNFNTTKLLQDQIEFVDTPAVIDPVGNSSIMQGQQINITVTATDYDNQSLTFSTNQSNMTVTQLTNTSARLSWTPKSTDVGIFMITLTAYDGFLNATKVFIINVTDVNDPPTINPVATISGYYGVRQAVIITAFDPDNNENITFSVTPAFFPVITTTIYTSNNSSSSPGTIYGIANFTPADPEKGAYNLTFTVNDGTYSASTNTSMLINYCGDNVCQTTYENETSCPDDCAEKVRLEQIALIVQQRNCANQSLTIHTFNATDRFSCYYEGLVEQGFALCEGLDGVTVRIYLKDGFKLTDKGSFTSGANGTVQFTPDTPGEYKISAMREDFNNVSAMMIVRSCNNDIVVQNNNRTITQPPLPPPDKKPVKPTEEQPGVTQQQASWLSIFFFYFLIPLLLAGLVYTSTVFYDVNKDTLSWLLETRIFVYQQRVKYEPQIKLLQSKVQPVMEPVLESVGELYNRSLKPLVDKLKNIGKKP